MIATLNQFLSNYVRQPAGVMCSNRLLEWVASLALVMIGVNFLFAGNERWALLFLPIGVFRLSALAANGHWYVWGPRIRILGAILSAAIWWNLSIVNSVDTDPLPAFWVYVALTIGELISVYRAAADVRTIDERGP